MANASGHPAMDQVGGMLLEEAFVQAGFWVGQLRTSAGSTGGWHHHGDHETYTYLAEGKAAFEWGTQPRDRAELKAGDFIHIPPRQIHRESNPGTTPNLLIVFRKGEGPKVVLTGPP